MRVPPYPNLDFSVETHGDLGIHHDFRNLHMVKSQDSGAI